MMKRRPETNVHHIISQNLRDEYRVDMEENKIRMSIIRHDALHKLFGMLHQPKEQLMELRAIYDWVLSSTAKQLFSELLALPDDKFFIDWMVKHGKRAKWQRDKRD